jgi:hypothetical protein
MRVARGLLLVLGTALPAFSPASANDGFALVIPGRAGVPIVINRIDASYAVVESDWGLAKNVHIQPTVYGGRPIDPGPAVGHYYPSAGHTPGYGRLEIQPPANRPLPRPAASYHQSWSAQSNSQAAQSDVPFYPPPVIEAPGRWSHPGEALPHHSPTPPHDFRHRDHPKRH